MVSAGDRSHHGGGPMSPRPTGSGSRSRRRCSMAAQRAEEPRREGARTASVSAEQLGAVGSKCCPCCPGPQFLFPRARPAPHPHPDTCDHRRLPLAEAKDFLEEDREPARFLNRRHASPGRHRAQRGQQRPGAWAHGKNMPWTTSKSELKSAPSLASFLAVGKSGVAAEPPFHLCVGMKMG